MKLAWIECQTNNGVTLAKNAQLERELSDWKHKAKTRWMWIALLIGGAAAYTAFKIWKPKINI